MQAEVISTIVALMHPCVHAQADPVVLQASLGIPDTFFIFVVALVVFGPKRLPEIGKQIGKLVFEFRRASNDFKLQIEEELRLSDQQEKQKQLQQQAAAQVQPTAVALSADASVSSESSPPAASEGTLVIQPPSSGDPVEAQRPNRVTSAPIANSSDPVEEKPFTMPIVETGEHSAREHDTETKTEAAVLHDGLTHG